MPMRHKKFFPPCYAAGWEHNRIFFLFICLFDRERYKMTLAAFLFFILEAVLIFLCYFFPDLNELRWASGRVLISAQKHEYI